jgi:predicted glycoside hydrolase/deacetylase ChbG (UPF0249 family)
MKKLILLTVAALALAPVVFAQQTAAPEKTYAERLGWPAGSKVVIFHVDDAGMCHDANMGAKDALGNGVACSTSVMFPCAAVPEFMEIWKANPTWDVGVHLTMTAEWKNYRWGPVAGKETVPGLVDKEGCMWPEVFQVMKSAMPDEVETEIRAQVDRCTAFGMKPTHLDSHMGTVFADPRYTERYVKVGIEMGIPVLMPGGHMQYVARNNPMAVKMAGQVAQQIWDAGLPVIDDINTGDFPEGAANKTEQVCQFLREMKPGITYFIVHCTRPSAVFEHISSSGGKRLAETEAMISPEVKKVVKDEGIILTTWRELKERRDKTGK